MVGLHGAEDSACHGGLEVCGWVESGDLTGEVLPDAEMSSSPGDLVPEAGEAGGDTPGGDSLLAGVDVAKQMYLDAAGEIEAAFDGGCDNGDLLNADHGERRPSCVRVNVSGFYETTL